MHASRFASARTHFTANQADVPPLSQRPATTSLNLPLRKFETMSSNAPIKQMSAWLCVRGQVWCGLWLLVRGMMATALRVLHTECLQGAVPFFQNA